VEEASCEAKKAGNGPEASRAGRWETKEVT
jgi:hypothetical protein